MIVVRTLNTVGGKRPYLFSRRRADRNARRLGFRDAKAMAAVIIEQRFRELILKESA